MGQLLFKKCFWDAIRSGSKRTTLRRWQRPRVPGGGRVYAPGVGWLRVTGVAPVELSALDDDDAKADGFESLSDMKRALLEIYPEQASDGKRWFRVEFEYEQENVSRQKARRRSPARK